MRLREPDCRVLPAWGLGCSSLACADQAEPLADGDEPGAKASGMMCLTASLIFGPDFCGVTSASASATRPPCRPGLNVFGGGARSDGRR